MKEFDKYTKALKEYQEYSRNYNEQVRKLRAKLKELESKKNRLETEITEKLINGESVDYSEVRRLQSDIDTIDRQIVNIENHRKKDKKLQRLADNVMKEFKELKQFERELLNNNSKEMKRLEEEYNRKRDELIQQRQEIQAHVRDISRPRRQVIDYVTDDIPKQDINMLRINS